MELNIPNDLNMAGKTRFNTGMEGYVNEERKRLSKFVLNKTGCLETWEPWETYPRGPGRRSTAGECRLTFSAPSVSINDRQSEKREGDQEAASIRSTGKSASGSESATMKNGPMGGETTNVSVSGKLGGSSEVREVRCSYAEAVRHKEGSRTGPSSSGENWQSSTTRDHRMTRRNVEASPREPEIKRHKAESKQESLGSKQRGADGEGDEFDSLVAEHSGKDILDRAPSAKQKKDRG